MSVAAAAVIVSAWFLSLVGCLTVKLPPHPSVMLGLVLLRTFLHTGLFIVAHDAMHNTLLPQFAWVNHWIGRFCLGLYGFLSYDLCLKCHWQHHRYPAQAQDPDFYGQSGDDSFGGLLLWYSTFIRSYLKAEQLLWVGFGTGLSFALACLMNLSLINVALFWLLPWLLSFLQLFIFGTYLPHRCSVQGEAYPTCSQYYPGWIAFLACYCLSYHWEHHTYPDVPWYRLPRVARLRSGPLVTLSNG